MGRQAFRAPTVVRIRTSICEYVIKSRAYVNCNGYPGHFGRGNFSGHPASTRLASRRVYPGGLEHSCEKAAFLPRPGKLPRPNLGPETGELVFRSAAASILLGR